MRLTQEDLDYYFPTRQSRACAGQLLGSVRLAAAQIEYSPNDYMDGLWSVEVAIAGYFSGDDALYKIWHSLPFHTHRHPGLIRLLPLGKHEPEALAPHEQVRDLILRLPLVPASLFRDDYRHTTFGTLDTFVTDLIKRKALSWCDAAYSISSGVTSDDGREQLEVAA